ncbi:hypothetical protein PWT90_02217 [Aphanocladium album]|nr:hypothetical protein PWT90_02217 [Aphanocladium album]
MKSGAIVFALLSLTVSGAEIITMDDYMKMDLFNIINHIPSRYSTCMKANYDKYCKGTKYEGVDCFCSPTTPLPLGNVLDTATSQCEQKNCRRDILDRDQPHYQRLETPKRFFNGIWGSLFPLGVQNEHLKPADRVC